MMNHSEAMNTEEPILKKQKVVQQEMTFQEQKLDISHTSVDIEINKCE